MSAVRNMRDDGRGILVVVMLFLVLLQLVSGMWVVLRVLVVIVGMIVVTVVWMHMMAMVWVFVMARVPVAVVVLVLGLAQ